MDQAFFTGVDAGGTKTTIALADNKGKIIVQETVKPGNILNRPLDQLFPSILTSLKNLMLELRIKPEQIKTGCFGMAGLDTQTQFTQLAAYVSSLPLESRLLLGNTALFVNDAYIGIRSISQAASAVGVIAGTGSNCYGVNSNGAVWSSGNWGYLLGDNFSGFALGQALIKQGVAEYDGRAGRTALTSALLHHYQAASMPDIISKIYLTEDPVPYMAEAVLILSNPGLLKQPFVKKQIANLVDNLAISYQTVVKQLFEPNEINTEVVAIGGLWRIEDFSQAARRAILSFTPKARLLQAQTPVRGAIYVAKNYPNATQLPNRSVVLKN